MTKFRSFYYNLQVLKLLGCLWFSCCAQFQLPSRITGLIHALLLIRDISASPLCCHSLPFPLCPFFQCPDSGQPPAALHFLLDNRIRTLKVFFQFSSVDALFLLFGFFGRVFLVVLVFFSWVGGNVWAFCCCL